MKLDYIQKNPMKLVELPRKKEVVIVDEESVENFYDKDELKLFLQCAQSHGNYKAFAMLRLLTFSGMRKNEAAALLWSDINFKDNTIRINKAIARGKDSRLYVKSTKTGIARIIKMDEITMSILEEWKKRQKQDYFKLGINTLQPKQLVFSNTKNDYLHPTATNDWIKQITTRYDLKSISTHGLRHTCCSLMFEAGASIKEVQEHLGHADAQTTMNIYAHVTEKAKDEAIQKYAQYIDF